LKGSIVAIVTPMNQDETIDFDSFIKLIKFHEDSRTDGIVLVGTTGESATLSKTEREEIFKFAKSATNIPLIAGIGSSSTSEACELADIALKNDIRDCLAVTPYYNKPSQKGLSLHYEELSKTGANVILYNVPGRTGVDLLPSTVLKLTENQNITGIKEAVNTESRFKDLLAVKAMRPDFLLLSGDDPTFVSFMKSGADGIISVAANVMPKQIKKLSDLCFSKKFEEAEAINKKYLNLYELLFTEASPSPCKFLLEKMLLLENNLRLPLHPLSEEFKEEIYEAFNKI
jgi:4-hydroxy-tetrahydrodipicolinate synthase|tara:strand:+ start:9976 stop:10836 length:861 start_codon:yes stop_codon:yes gene_type:complete